MQIASKFIAVFLLTAYSQFAPAAGPTVESVTGASSFTTSGSVEVWGGTAGSSCSSTVSNSSTCNNCFGDGKSACATAPNLCVCNERRIYDGLILRINVKAPTDDADKNHDLVAQYDNGTATELEPVTINNGGTFIDFRWTDICNKMSGTTNCNSIPRGTTTFTLPVRIQYDRNDNNTFDSTGDGESTLVTFRVLPPDSNDAVFVDGKSGIKSWKPYPGDGKIFVEGTDGGDLEPDGNYPTLDYNGGVAKSLRVFAAEGGLDKVNYSNSALFQTKDLTIDENGFGLDDTIYDGLDNDTLYFFRLAILDQAGNVVMFVPGTNVSGCNSTDTANSKELCAYAARPSEVLGLLTKDLNCFIATAALGSPLYPQLETLRRFRNRVLLPRAWGRDFIQWYYTYGPIAARYIHDKPVLRALVRAPLWPLVGFSKLTFKIGLVNAALVSLAMLMAMAASLVFAIGRIKRRA